MYDQKEEDFVQQMDPKSKEPQSSERKWGWIILVAALLGGGSVVFKYVVLSNQSNFGQPTQSQPSTNDSPFK